MKWSGELLLVAGLICSIGERLRGLIRGGTRRNEQWGGRETPLVFLRILVNIDDVKSKPSSTRKSEPKQQGNYIDAFVKRMFVQTVVFVDFLLNYADSKFVAEVDVTKIQPAPTHYIGQKGDERIIDLVFQCPLKNGDGSLMAVIVFEHQSKSLKEIPQKLQKYISAIWDAEKKENKPLSAPYFIVLRTGKKPHRGGYPTMADLLPKGSDGKPLGHVPEIKYDVVDLPAWDFGKLIGGAVLRLVLGMLHKMTGGNLDEFPEALRLLSDITDEEQQVELTKELMDFVAKAFQANNRLLDKATVAKVLNPIFRGREIAMIKTIFEEREDIGEARGIAIGETRGEVKAARNLVLKALRKKFGKIPKKIEQAILVMSDPIALESLLEHVFDCKTLDEFATVL